MEEKFKIYGQKILAKAQAEIYLVGGAVRDIYLGRKVTDYDFAYGGNAIELAQSLAEALEATYVTLDAEHDIARLVLKPSGEVLYFDFCGFKGENILADLQKRDFTINALAISLQREEYDIIDPLHGLEDIKAQRISAISEESFIEDPLRILRAVRLAVELNYNIDPQTLNFMLKHRKLLAKVSPERIRDELFKAFTVDAYKTVLLLDAWEFFEICIPEVASTKGVTQNRYHTLDVWGHSLAALKHLEQEILVDNKFLTSEVEAYLTTDLVQGRTKKALLKLGALLHDVGKPVVKKIHPEKGIIFWNHDLVGSDMVSKIASRMQLAKKEINFLHRLVKYHMRPLFLSKSKSGKKALFKFFKETGEDGLSIIIHAMADTMGGKNRDKYELEAFLQAVTDMRDFYFQEYLPKQKLPLLGGKDILDVLPQIPPHKVGEVLEQISESYNLGKITTSADALQYIKKKYKFYTKP